MKQVRLLNLSRNSFLIFPKEKTWPATVAKAPTPPPKYASKTFQQLTPTNGHR